MDYCIGILKNTRGNSFVWGMGGGHPHPCTVEHFFTFLMKFQYKFQFFPSYRYLSSFFTRPGDTSPHFSSPADTSLNFCRVGGPPHPTPMYRCGMETIEIYMYFIWNSVDKAQTGGCARRATRPRTSPRITFASTRTLRSRTSILILLFSIIFVYSSLRFSFFIPLSLSSIYYTLFRVPAFYWISLLLPNIVVGSKSLVAMQNGCCFVPA